MFTNTIHGGGAPSMTTSVYYTGSDTLLEGYALCYDFNAADVNQENATQTSPDVGEEYWADARRILVEKPQEGNKMHFAGVVAAQSDGVTGPGWVTIHRPGSVCNVYAASDCDHEEGTGYASSQILNVLVGSYAMQAGGFPGKGAALVLQDVDRSSTNGLVMAELLDGQPSGGIANVDTDASNTASVSAILSMVPVWCGLYQFSDGAAASSGVIVSSNILAADGNMIGKRFQIAGDAALISVAISIVVSSASKAMYSSYDNSVTSVLCEVSANNEYFQFEFDGNRWIAVSGHEVCTT